MKKILMACIVLFVLSYTSNDYVFTVQAESKNEATKSGLKSRMKRLPGEQLMYDPHTGVIFNPYNGKIENFKKEYARLPGEPLYYKKGHRLKYFKPSIYAQFVPKTIKLINKSIRKNMVYINGKSKKTAGWTTYFGVTFEGGILSGGSLGGSFAISYDQNKKAYYVSWVGSGGPSIVLGEKLHGHAVIGVIDGNHLTLNGPSINTEASLPIASFSVSTDGKNKTYQIGLGIGTSYSITENFSYTKAFSFKLPN